MWLFCTCIFYQTHNIFHFERMYIILFFPRTFKLKYQFAICAFLQSNCVPWMVSTQETLHRAPCCIPSISTLWSSSIWYNSSLFQTASSCVLTIQGTQLLCRNAQTANWYLSLNVLGYRYKKQGLCPYDQYEKIWELIILEQNVIFTRARAADMSSIYRDFQGFVYYTLVYLFTKWFLWKFFEEKITKKNVENIVFLVFFWKWLKFKTSAREVKTQNNKNPRDTILYYVLFFSFDNISHHVTHYPGSLSPSHVRIS